MATEATAAASTPKPKTVLEDMDSRRMFDTPELAAQYLNQMGETLSDFASAPMVLKGVDAEGNFDPSIYTDSMRVMVAVLTQRVKDAPSKVQAIVVTPAPTLDSILANPLGKDWLQKIVDKELNHVAVRPLRAPKDGDTLDTLAEQMPTTLEGYVSSQREGGGILETYNELARGIIDAIAKKSKPWQKARLTKPELKSAMASKAYAAEYYPTLEDRGEGKESLFVMALNFAKQVAVSKSLDPAIFDKWLTTRDEATLVSKSDDSDDDGDFDLDSLTFAEPEQKPAEADAAAEVQTESEQATA